MYAKMFVIGFTTQRSISYHLNDSEKGRTDMSENQTTNTNPTQEKVWTIPFIMVFLNSMVVTSTQWAVSPMISSYSIDLGASLKTASLISSLMSITAMFLRPVSGYVVDRMNRKKLLTITTAVNVLLAIMHMFATNIPFLAVCRVLQGITFAFSGVASMALSTSVVPTSRLGEGMGWMALANVISQSLGPSVGTFLIEKSGYAACFAFCAVASALSLFILRFIPYTYEPRPVENRKLRLSDIICFYIIPYSVIMGLFSSCNGLDNTFLALLGKERGITGFSLFFTAYSIVMFLCRPIAGKLLDRYGLDYTIYPALCATAISACLTGSAYSLTAILIAGALKGLGQSAGSPGIQATCLKRLGKEKAGIISSTCYIFQDIGNSVAPLIGGVVAERWGYTTMFWGYGVILVVCGSLIYRFKSQYDKTHPYVEN